MRRAAPERSMCSRDVRSVRDVLANRSEREARGRGARFGIATAQIVRNALGRSQGERLIVGQLIQPFFALEGA